VRRRQRLILALAVLAGAAQCGTTGQPPPAHAFPVQEFTLPSGLKVVIEQDDVSTIAGIVVVVDVGSVDDPKGKSGMAHVLEHLVFRVAAPNEKSLRRQLAQMGAAYVNAETDTEDTTYHAFAPRKNLDELVSIVLARLADPMRGATQQHVDKEVSITAEEMRRREGAHALEFLVPELMPAGHPVGRAWADFRRSDPLSLADLRAFADTFYRPERMTVVISGPIPPDWDKTLFAKMPAVLRGNEAARVAPIRRQVAPYLGPARAETELPTHAAKVEVPELWIAWRVPPAVGVEARKEQMVAHVIDMVLSSRLDPDGTNDVLDVDGFAFPGRLSSIVGCRFKLRAASDAVRIRNEARLAMEALADATLVSIKGRLYWSHVYALQAGTLVTALQMDTITGRAFARADLAHAGSSALISTVLGAMEKVTSDDMTDFAARYLAPDAARSVLVVPADRNATRARRSGDTKSDPIIAPGTEVDRDRDEIDSKEDVDLPDQAKLLATTQVPGTRAALVRKLSNGLTVIAMRRPGLPFVSMLLGFHADPQPGDAPGARYAYERTLRWDLSAGPWERGILSARHLYADHAQESLRMFSGSVEKALDFMSEEADSLHVYWPNPAFDRWLDETAVSEATPEGQAARVFRAELFGNHPYQLSPKTAEMRTVTEREIKAWFDRVRRPANGAMVVVGEIDPEGIVRDTERMLHSWKGAATAPPAPPAPPPLPPPAPRAPPDVVIAGSGARTVHTLDTRRRSADVRFGCFLPPVRAQRDEVVQTLLAHLMDDGLYSRLRWKMGVSYAPDVDAQTQRGGTAWIDGRVDVDARALPEAMSVLHAWLDQDAAVPVDAQRFEQLRWYMARRIGTWYATGQQLAYALFEAWNKGWEPAVLDDYARDLASVTVKDVTAALEVCRRSAVISVLGPDAP
jgi:zinc protease